MFSWGYAGWGSSTRQLRQAVDVVEQSRGYEAPFFVDIRMKRSGRAVGFKNDAFEKLMGRSRYLWMPALGNRRIKTRTGPRIQINEPEGAEALLGLALALRKKRRVIFFCQCPEPGPVHNPSCHRVVVASALLKIARKRNVDLQISEWPGGTPQRVAHELTDDEAKDVLRGRRSLPLGRRRPPIELLSLPWDSIVRFRSPTHSFRALAGPARFIAGEWILPLPFGANENDTFVGLAKRAKQDRRSLGLNTRRQ